MLKKETPDTLSKWFFAGTLSAFAFFANDTRNALPSVILFANLIPGGFSLVKINSIEESADVAYSLSF